MDKYNAEGGEEYQWDDLPPPPSIKEKIMKTKLKAVSPKTTEPSKPKMLIYGKPGVGKSWAALDFPGVYYIDSEGGADLHHYTDKLKTSGGVYLGPDEGAADLATILEQVQALATENHIYKTLVIDSISKAFNNEIAKEAERLADKNAFGAEKKPAISLMRRLVRWLQRIDMNVVLIAHEKPEWGQNAKGEREEIGATFDCWDKLEYELHLCLNVIKAGPKRLAKVRKTRLKQFSDGEIFEWSFENFAKKYGENIIQKEGKEITLISPEQLNEIRALTAIVRLPEGWEERCLRKADVDCWEELDANSASKVLLFLRNKQLGGESNAV